jgi:hypothetical protein
MRSLTIEEIRLSWFPPDSTSLKLIENNALSYQTEGESYFVVRTPPEHMRIVALAYSILLQQDHASFKGGLIWLQMWQVGSPQMVRPGWKILEGMRRAQGDLRSLDIAPAQAFRHDELVELHAWLIQVMAYGWFAYFVPSVGDYYVLFTTTGRILFTAKSPETLDTLFSGLKSWGPTKENPDAPGPPDEMTASAPSTE